MRNALRVLALAAWLLAVWPMTWSGADSADVALEKYGWWNANQALPADPTGGLLGDIEVPPPAGAPGDGLYVESAADGSPLAIGGVSFYTGGGVDALLTLAVTEGSSSDGTTLAACPADGGWDAAQNGRWERRPQYDDTACVLLGQVTGTSVSFAIPATAHEAGSSYLSLVIVPAEGSGAFSVGFDPPDSSSLVTTSASAGGSSEPEAATPPAFQPGSASISEPSFTAAPPAVIAPPAAAASGDGGPAAAGPSAPVALGATRPIEADDRTDRVTAAVALAVIGAGLWFLASRQPRSPRLLGSVGTAAAPATVLVSAPSRSTRARGLGRFARHRDAPPTAI